MNSGAKPSGFIHTGMRHAGRVRDQTFDAAQ
jgi:hypothetical protein